MLTVAGFLLALLLAARVLQEKRQPGSTLAWLLAIALIPYIGVPLYLLLGGRKLDRFVKRKGKLYNAATTDASVAELSLAATRIVTAAGMPPPRSGNHVSVHFSGETAFTSLLKLCESAQESIYVATFILGRDATGRAIVDVLARKAREGVEVRLLLDGLGCIWSSGSFAKPLRRAGGRVERFMPVIPLQRRWSANLRNHRKIVVVDHVAAMVGGMNLATEFMGIAKSRKRFIDSAVFFAGPAISDIEDIFLNDWEYATAETKKESVDADFSPDALKPYITAFNAPATTPAAPHASTLQVIASGPDVPEDTFHDALITAIMDASERIWLVTPYFVPDESIIKALALKARAGCDVRVLAPLRSNHHTADLARGPAFREITAAGATIYAYSSAMVHAKIMLFDRKMVITGSPNLDMRSIYLNFEVALFHYSPEEIDLYESWIRDMQKSSHIMRPETVSNSRAWAENFCRLISPLL